jgi:arginine decarboxylase-like protein
MSEKYEIRVNQVRNLINEADAEVRDGEGVEFGSSAALAVEIARRGRRDSILPPRALP